MPKKRLPSPLGYASKLRYDLIKWDKLTQKEITQKDKNNVSFLMHIAKDGHWSKLPEKFKKLSLTQPAAGKDKLIHFMAKEGKIKTISKELITEELLSLQGNQMDSVYHLLSSVDPTQIDKGLWTKKALTIPNDENETPLHGIVKKWSHLLPPDISLSDLLLEKDEKTTPLCNWASNSDWVKIPENLLTKQTLELKIGEGIYIDSDDSLETLFEFLMERFREDKPLGSPKETTESDLKIRKILKNVRQELLESALIRYENTSLTKHIKIELYRRKISKNSEKFELKLEM